MAWSDLLLLEKHLGNLLQLGLIKNNKMKFVPELYQEWDFLHQKRVLLLVFERENLKEIEERQSKELQEQEKKDPS